MVTTTAADSSSNHHSPTSAAAAANSPKFPRKNLPSPWAQVVRGADSEPLHPSPPPSSSPSSSSSSLDFVNSVDNPNNAGTPKKPAWKSPSNGAVVADVGPVMGAVSWPPLSAKPSGKLTSDSSAAAAGSLSTTQGPVISHLPQKQATTNAKPTPAMNYGMPNRQRPMKRGGGNINSFRGLGPVQNSFSSPYPNLTASPPLTPSPPPPFPVLQIPPGAFANGVPGPSPRDPYMNSGWDMRSPVGGYAPPMNGHRGPSRRGNFGHHPRGDGPYHNYYGSRRDQGRGNANNRDPHAHQQRMPPRGFMRPPPPNPASFMGPQPLRPVLNPEIYYYPTLPSEPFGGMPFFTHAPPAAAMVFPVAETPLTNTIRSQIDYYFSDTNLVKDPFLRSNMDDQGWVPITLIAGFPRVKNVTSNIELILDSLRTSTVVEVQGDKLRRRNEWMRWLPSAHRQSDSGSISRGGSSCNSIADDFEKITLDEATTDKVNSNPTTIGGATGESSNQSQLPSGDSTWSSN